MTNVGLGAVPAPIEFDLDNFQGIPQMDGVNRVGKGYNEFVLYGERERYEELKLGGLYYYLYVAMSWDNGNGGVLKDEGAGKGLFFKNNYTDITEGWYCTRDSSAYFNWLCEGTKISEAYWAPEIEEMPNDRAMTSWWVCGVEDFKTYTQAQCKQQLIEEADFGTDQRVRYGDEMNLEFWGLSFE